MVRDDAELMKTFNVSTKPKNRFLEAIWGILIHVLFLCHE